ncbi:hypothetical protein TRICI_004206 [Trichomonascus ciferrii]|uniref:Uncharacterized protein n=1 Tax=Trichomonascus ciferrii TaxID=44093 RepID=A0A642V1M8_9ASCO|nr:hypothetical protein TRICI_004206 [Trichomonascus ciferrii]
MVYEIGWDLPGLLLNYIVIKNGRGPLRAEPTVTLVMEIFSLLAKNGNPKELYLKAIESLAGLDVELKLSEEFEATGSPADEDYANESVLICQFYAVFELMQSSMAKIKTKYPSRFLATSTNALLSFAALAYDRFSWRGKLIIMRRLFTFARDFAMDSDEAELAETEISYQQQLLRSYLTWVADICLHRVCALWSEQIFFEMKSRFTETKTKYELSANAASLSECLERLYQLALSFDMSLKSEFLKLVKAPEQILEDDLVETEAKEDEVTNPFAKPSKEGIILLYTQEFFKERPDTGAEIDFETMASFVITMLQREDGTAPLGIVDSVIFWLLWSSKAVTKEQVQNMDATKFCTLVQSVMMVAATPVAQMRSPAVFYSLATRLLYLQKDEITLDFMIDTLEYCPFENVCDATVRLLKDFILRKRPSICCQSVESLEDDIKNLSVEDNNNSSSNNNDNKPRLALKEDKKAKIKELILNVLDAVETEGIFSEQFQILLSWLNFVTVIETDQEFLKKVVQRVDGIRNENDQQKDEVSDRNETQKRLGILQLAIDSINKKWFSN